jgi:hypothetical protein
VNELRSLADRFAGLSSPDPDQIGFGAFGFALLLALAASLLIALLYVRYAAARGAAMEMHRVFPLLGIAVTAIFICIQLSLPLSLGLLGALSIVRFRTPVKEPEEVGFILVVIAAGLACATFNLRFLVGLVAAAWLALVVRRWARGLFRAPASPGSLMVSLSEDDYAAHGGALIELVESAHPGARLESLSRVEQDVVLTVAMPALATGAAVDLERRIRALAAPRQLTILTTRLGIG